MFLTQVLLEVRDGLELEHFPVSSPASGLFLIPSPSQLMDFVLSGRGIWMGLEAFPGEAMASLSWAYTTREACFGFLHSPHFLPSTR